MSINIHTIVHSSTPQHIGSTQFGTPVVLLKGHDKLGPAGTVIIPLNLPGPDSALLSLRYSENKKFQIVIDKSLWDLPCRPLENGEYVTIGQVKDQ